MSPGASGQKRTPYASSCACVLGKKSARHKDPLGDPRTPPLTGSRWPAPVVWRALAEYGWPMVMRALLAGVGVVALSGSAQAALKPPVFAAAVSVAPVSGADIGGASEIASGDLDGDGLPDVVLTRITFPTAHVTHPVGIFLADGHRGFKDGSSMWSGPPARTEFGRQIIIADFNGDHRNDIFVADHGYDAPPFPGHPNTLVLSTPDGKLVDDSANLPPESGFSHSAAAADVNGDGSVDLYVGNLCTACTDAPPEILLNDGTGHFTRRTDLLPEDLADLDDHHRYTRSLFVDVNSDGAPDLVLGADDHTLDSRVLLNHGTDHFHDAPAPLPPKPLGSGSILISLATLDVNRDGKPDLIAGFQNGDFTGRRLQILIGNGDGTFRDETAQRLPSQDSGQGWPYAIRIADFNGDGLPDFTVDVNAYPVEDAPLYLDDGTGVYHPVPFGGNPGQFWTIVDANNDGHPDIFSVLSGNPEQHFVQLEVIPPGAPHGFHAASRRNKIHLSWTPEFGLIYEIWRAVGASGTRKLIGKTTGGSFDDTRARRAVTYSYVLRARNAAGAGPFTAPVRARRS
jgi:FG-GAP-like repeat